MSSYLFASSFGKVLLVEETRGGYIEDLEKRETLHFSNKKKLWNYANSHLEGYNKYKLILED